jgi:hypothetical protein
MTRHLAVRRLTALGTGTLAALALTGAGATAVAAPVAQAATTINVRETASLHLVKKSGATLYEAGTASGTLPGTITARFNVGVTKVSGSVRITTRGGTLTMSVQGTARSGGTVPRFGGTMRVTGGTGKFARASGSATFSGTVNRRTWASTVSATGRLSY